MKKVILSYIMLSCACASAYASSNGGVRALQPVRVPVILANYSNVTFKNTDFNDYFASVQQYFNDQSFGKYQPVFDVIGPVNLPNKQKYYGENDYYGDDLRADEMVAEACNLAENLADFTPYDQDGDGKLDAVVILYAGEGEVYGVSNEDAVWAYTANLEESDELEYLVQLDGKTVTYFSAVPELQSTTKRDGIGTLIHEFAHILGLPNLCTTSGGFYKTLGNWDVMDHGSYNNEARTPAALSAYERFYLGWVEPILLDEPMNVRLRDLNTSGDCAIITEDGQSNLNGISPDPRKFYMLENRQQTGWDQYLPGHGLMLTKIDYVKNKWESDEVNNVENHPCVDLIEADGSRPHYKADKLDNGYFGKTGDLFPEGATEFKMFSNKQWFSGVQEQGDVILFDFQDGVGKCTVSFYVNGDQGTCTAAQATETKKGAGVVLPTVSAKTGYTFLGWSTRKNSGVPDAGQPGDRYYPMCNGTVFAVMKNNTKYWIHYDLTGVKIGDYFDQYGKINYDNFNGAYIKVSNVQNCAISFKSVEGYASLAPASCVVRVECGGKVLIDAARFGGDSVLVSLPATAITSDIYITINNVHEQSESGCDTYSHTFVSECHVAKNANYSGYEWSVSIANDQRLDYDKNKGAIFGSGTYPAGLVKLRTEATLGCGVAMIRVTAAAGSQSDATLSVYVAGNQIGDAKYLNDQLETFEFQLDEAVSGVVEIRLQNSKNALYLKQIEIYYELLDEPTDIVTVESQEPKVASQKRLINGQLYIRHNGQIYNVLGERIK